MPAVGSLAMAANAAHLSRFMARGHAETVRPFTVY
jgi:hypothetical protein